ncbi:hypothetical protein BJ322DRAFT_1103445 [Thelephora terrestris]|uniref:Uncharacterized protein n=1 Tax=Thelephora terrestris TaxID=56493 RepID=A0A9P6LCR1_9AGAM|nr:hypothetical protein BJ322DRAFT_1103445 [Thelephora terrestris]
MSQSVTTASILGVVLGSVLYGIFVPLLLTSCYVQWRRRAERHTTNPVMVFTTVFYGLTVTATWVLSFTKGMRGILFLPPGENAEAFFGDFSNPLMIAKVTILEIQVLVADCIMIYRLYHIYNKNIAVCVLPSICSIIDVVHIFAITIQSSNRGSPSSKSWGAIGFGVLTFNSIYLPSLIATRLWRTHNLFTETDIRVSHSIVTRAMYVFIESAVLWTTLTVINFILYLAKSSGLLTVLDMLGPTVGISFCLIIVRLGHSNRRFSIPSIKIPESTAPTTITMTALSTSRSTSREDLQQGHETKTQCNAVEPSVPPATA